MFGFKKKPIKFCKDCKFSTVYNKCMHPKSLRENDDFLVSGFPNYTYCSAMRTWNCGKKAKYFKPKEIKESDND